MKTRLLLALLFLTTAVSSQTINYINQWNDPSLFKSEVKIGKNLRVPTGKISIGKETADASSILDLTSTKAGFLLPRMTEAQKNNIVNPAEGLLMYQTDATTGFYYYRGGWYELAGGGMTIGADVTGGNNTRILYVDASGQLNQSNQFTFNYSTNTLNLGGNGGGFSMIKLWNNSGTNFTQLAYPDAGGTDPNFIFPNTAGTNGYVLKTDGSGVTSWQPGLVNASETSGFENNRFLWIDAAGVYTATNLSYYLGNVGVGTATPGKLLDVTTGGSTRFTVDDTGNEIISNTGAVGNVYSYAAYVQDNPLYVWSVKKQGTGSTWIYVDGNNFRLGDYDNAANGTNIEIIDASEKIILTGNVGVGTSTPSATLDVVGSLQYADGNEGAGKVLTSDASGNASWQSTPEWTTLIYTVISDSILTAYDSPDTIVLAPGAGYAWQIISVTASIANVTTAYTNQTGCGLLFPAASNNCFTDGKILDATVDRIVQFQYSAVTGATQTQIIENEPIVFTTSGTGNATDGDGDLTLYLTLRKIQL